MLSHYILFPGVPQGSVIGPFSFHRYSAHFTKKAFQNDMRESLLYICVLEVRADELFNDTLIKLPSIHTHTHTRQRY